jgi:FkbM family methyltransferase
VVFKNGTKLHLTWAQFRILRDYYPYWSKFKIEQIDDNLFKLKQEKNEITGNLPFICLISELIEKYGCTITQKGTECFDITVKSFKLVGSSEMLIILQELLSGTYDCYCQDKTILDIGGFEGETVVYFSSLGAKKVLMYEPIPVNFERARENIERNGVNAELFNYGIDEADGSFEISFRSNKATCLVKNISAVILESKADIVKIDCEGAEQCLVTVSNELLRSADLYLIELHSSEIRRKVLEKFNESGFIVFKDITLPDNVSIVQLKRQP